MFESDEDGRDEALERARAALLAVGDRARGAEADALLAQFWWVRGDRDRCFEHLSRGHELVRDAPPSPGKARVLSQLARFRTLAGEFDSAEASEALELAERFGLDEIRAHALMTLATGRIHAGDRGGRADAERGLEIAVAGNLLPAAVRAYTVLATVAETEGDLREALRLGLEAEKVSTLLGEASLRWTRGNLISLWLELGEWDECRSAADEFLAQSESGKPHYHDAVAFRARAFLRAARGNVDGAVDDAGAGLARAREVKDPQVVYPMLGACACVYADAGRLAEANRFFDELVSAGGDTFAYEVADIIWAADMLNRRDEVRAALPTRDTPWFQAARALLDAEFERAAEIFDSIGAARGAALARLRAAEALAEAGRRPEADEKLRQALAFWRGVGATRYVRKGEALLVASA
jgi:ATP/maltotriose-dependent transcriptional regulator MalT